MKLQSMDNRILHIRAQLEKGYDGNTIQKENMKTEWGIKRQTLQGIIRDFSLKEPIHKIKNDNNMWPSTKKKLISEIRKNFKAGKHVKNLDLIKTIYRPQEPGYNHAGSP